MHYFSSQSCLGARAFDTYCRIDLYVAQAVHDACIGFEGKDKLDAAIESGGYIDYTVDGCSGLAWLLDIPDRRLSSFEALLSRGADPEIMERSGKVALTQAVEYGMPELAECLLRAGADPCFEVTGRVRCMPCHTVFVNYCWQDALIIGSWLTRNGL